MLATSLLLFNNDLKVAIIVLIAMTVLFCVGLCFKQLRKNLTLLVSLASAVIYLISLFCGSYAYYNSLPLVGTTPEITATVLTTPVNSDYSYTYLLGLDTVNGEKSSYKIKYITDTDKGFAQGDKVKGEVKLSLPDKSTDRIEYGLSDKIYFYAFEEETDTLARTGETNRLHHYLGVVKNYFVNTTLHYLPNENGAIANAMVIGERSGISEYTKNTFNYSGASHLLVVSGLHLTMWSLGIMRLMGKSRRLRKIMIPVGFFGLFFYSALTGFSVSVLRAGAMVGGILLGKLFRRGSDSLNSIGFALTFILLINPFAAFSMGLWLSVLSTTGILLASGKTYHFIMERVAVKPVAHFTIVREIVKVASVSIPTAVFTLPVFIFQFGMLPVASVISNFFMVGSARMLMVITVVGMLARLLHLDFIANGAYFITGLIAEFLKFIAEKIGMAEWSTISVSHKYFKYFFILFLAVSIITIILKRYGKNIFKHTVTVMAVLFVLTAIYCTYDDRLTPSVDIVASMGNADVLLNSNGKNAFIDCGDEFSYYSFKDALNRHNKKDIDVLAVAKINEKTPSKLSKIQECFPVEKVLFSGKSPYVIENETYENVSKVTVDGTFTADISNSNSHIALSCKNCDVIILKHGAREKAFENLTEYDIIIMYESDYEKHKEKFKDISAEIYKINDGDSINIRF